MNNLKSTGVVFFLISLLSLFYTGTSRADPIPGINFPGPAIAAHVQPGQINVNYHFPSEGDIKAYSEFGFKIIRLAISWERLQPELGEPFDADYLARMDKFMQQAQKYGVVVLLDVHNYGRYKGELIGSEAVPIEAFETLWSGIAQHYKSQNNLMFGLMNEPNKHQAKTWSVIAQKAILAIRHAEATQKIMVPGTYYSSAARWMQKDGEYSNGEALKVVNDPQNNIVFEAHQYLDKYASGTDANCVSSDIGVERLTAFTDWLKQNNYQGFLGEFAAGSSETCQLALENMLNYINANSDVWYGWSYWVADPWFGNYRFNIYPPDPAKYPQVKILQNFISQ